MNITKIYDSLNQLQKTSIFMQNYLNEDIIIYMMENGFYIDDAYFLLPFISNQYKLEQNILKRLIISYFDEMIKLLPTCPDYVVNNVYILLNACVKYENDTVINIIKEIDLNDIFEFDSKIFVLSQFGFKLFKQID